MLSKRCRISRFVGKEFWAAIILSLSYKKMERQEETREERGTLIPRGKKWVLIRKSCFH